MVTRRTLLKGAGASILPLFSPAVSRAQSRQVVKFVPQADLALLDPVQSPALVSRNHGLMVFDTLYGMDASFTIQPQMAAGHLVEDDGRRWTITLREGLSFHDGTPVRAKDAVASIERWWRLDVLGKQLAAITDELSAPTDKAIRFRLKQPFPSLPFALGKPSRCCFIMPERLAQTDPSKQITEMIGSGPFRFLADERMAGTRAVYEKFAGYIPRQEVPGFTAGGKIVHLDRVEWHTLPDASTAAAALRVGEMDWWEQPTADLLPQLKSLRGVTVDVKDKAGYLALLQFNHLQPPFNNPAIRRAFLAAVNQADYMTAVMGEDHSLWKDDVGFFLPNSPSASDVGLDVFKQPRSVEKVKKELHAAGYNGEKVVFLVPTDIPSLNAMSEIAADMFRRSGVNLDYQAMDWGTVLPRLNSQQPVDRGGWSVWCNYTSGILGLNPISHTFLRGIGANGFSGAGWPTSAALEGYRDAFMSTADTAEQKKIIDSMQRQAFEDVPYIPLGFYYQPTAYRSNLTGMVDGMPVFWNLKKG
ncbi:peptide/nickel transport system substrate-binding protein [Bradyrhizobium sp. cir1]|uniref:ABC transporter substrate-binding protein n=1 Tax=Bradyrhizobium sp. cir1 TaxID=1445730 RepID=UPI0016056464|nr:ABC transporter substrate-binding protein [Bradyrhizobium sp. cir1]MBB4368324.1 peptide/nickel transport system substrate-binding protein [Bradyrhizobium sp. cir1]